MPQRIFNPSDAKNAWWAIPRAMPPKRPPDERIGDYREIYHDYDEAAVRAQAARCIQCPNPPCRTGCPLANRIPEWLALAADGAFLEAAAVSRITSNLPEICSRVCPQERLCEGACILNGMSEPVAIGAVERFINEYAFARDAVEIAHLPYNGRRIAVVGSGPGGLSCADELAQRGCTVTVFESHALAGGLLVNGIPAFKLEKHLVQRRVDLLKANGTVFRHGVTIGRDLSLADLLREHDAVFLGVGAQQAKALDVPGAELTGVVQALPFLVQKNVGEAYTDLAPVALADRHVVVLGGGDTAMDCLRTALRGGAATATCLYRRDLANMPGSRKEFINAGEEGAQFRFLTNPLALVGDDTGAVTAVRCQRMELGEPDASGRRKPVPVAGADFTVRADLVLVAYGFDPVPWAPGSDLAQVKTNSWGGIVVDENQMTSVPGVFAGGDSVRGASLVVHAVRDARKAAQGIERWLASRAEDPAVEPARLSS